MRSVHEASREELAKVALRAYVPGTEAGAGASTQPEDPWTPSDTLRPPVDPEMLAAQTFVSPVRRSCIAAVTLNTVGLGCRLEVREGMEDEAPSEDEGAEHLRRLDAWARRDERLGRPNFTRLLSAAQWDRQEVGHGAIEVSRNRVTGEIDGLYHVPGKRIRRKADRTGWVIGPKGGRGTELTHYLDFGRKVLYDDEGRPQPKLAPGATRWDRNELIILRLFTSASRDYGLPPDAQLAIDYLGDKLASKTNQSYFDHSGVPPTVIFVQGREQDDDHGAIEVEIDNSFVEAITHTLTAGGSHSRVAVVPLPPGVETDKIDLAVLSERDIGFVAYRADNRRRTLGAYRLSPIFVADIEDAGKYTAEVERAITKEQVFDPEQREISDILSESIVREISPAYLLAFEEIAIKGDEARRDSANDLADRGKITNGEYREAHGYPPMPEATEGQEPEEASGLVPHGWNAQLVEERAATLNPFGAAPGAEEAIAKLTRGELASSIEDEFDRSIDEAVRAVSTMADGAELRPVVIEKTEQGIVVQPYSRNGAGS